MKLTRYPASEAWTDASRIKGEGSRTFLQSLPSSHRRKDRSHMRGYDTRLGHTIYKPVTRITLTAFEVWDDPEERKQWLLYHRATKRLLGNS